MSTEITSIQVEPDIANAYNAASQEDRKKIQMLMGLWLRELPTQPNMSLTESLTEVMDMISDRAQARGLTPEILESIFIEEQHQ